MNQQIVDIIAMHIEDPRLSGNLEFFRERHPEEYEQAKQKAAGNDSSGDNRETRKA